MRTRTKPSRRTLDIVGNMLVLGGVAMTAVSFTTGFGRDVLLWGLNGSMWALVAVGISLAVLASGFIVSSVAETRSTSTAGRAGAVAYAVVAVVIIVLAVPSLAVAWALAASHQYTEHVLADGRSVVVERSAFLHDCSVRILQRDGIHLEELIRMPGEEGCGDDPADDSIAQNSDGTISITIGAWSATVDPA